MKYPLPQKNKEFILIPSISNIKLLVEYNHELLNKIKIDKIPFLELRTQLHKSIFKESSEYIVATGHQPVIYHPGIIFKDIVVNALMGRYGFSGLNLVVDSDTIGDNQYVLIPVVKDGILTCENIQLFHCEKNLVFEDIPLPDVESYNQTLTYIKEKIKESLPEKNLKTFTNYMKAANEVLPYSNNLAQFNAFSKRVFEEKLGFKHTEIFLSSICQSKAFLYFFSLILSSCKQFVLNYNRILEEYKTQMKILKVTSNIIELPFWIWKGQEKRSTIYIKFNKGKTWICKGNIEILDIDIYKIEHLIETIDKVKNFYKIRPKALMLTLFARLFLCDLWIHGVGGAEYEELNDRLAQEFFYITLPKYAVASATLYLNLNIPNITNGEIKDLKTTLRKMEFNPEKFLTWQSHLIEIKEEIIKKMKKTKYKKDLHEQLAIINNKLRNKITPCIQDFKKVIFEKEELLKIATNRRFPFFIFPLDDLKSMLINLDDGVL